ncbi:TPA: hypothetical protein ACSCYS_003523 [Aeromonas veronii]
MKKNTVGAPKEPDEQTTLFDHFMTKFKRARCEDTLDLMYEGAINTAKKETNERKRFLTSLAIERAYDRCQQDFDNTVIGMERKANYAINKSSSSNSDAYNPEDKLRELLSSLPNS